MEDTLRDANVDCSIDIDGYVLILVLMEDTLRVHWKFTNINSLNPCSNGRYSQSAGKVGWTNGQMS